MEATKTKPLDLLDKHQLSQIREKSDFRNIFALCLDWGLIVFGLSIFYYLSLIHI